MQTLILVVDDNEAGLCLATTILRSRGYKTAEAGDGEAAVQVAARLRPDLILMDLSLPRMDGFEAMRCLQADPATRSIPVIVLTAHVLERDAQRELERQCAGFLEKPYFPSQLLDMVRRFARHAARTA